MKRDIEEQKREKMMVRNSLSFGERERSRSGEAKVKAGAGERSEGGDDDCTALCSVWKPL